jgi:hypothetical protein
MNKNLVKEMRCASVERFPACTETYNGILLTLCYMVTIYK